MSLQPLDRGSPLRCRRLANRVLVPKQPDLMYGLILKNGVQPLDTHEVLDLVGVICMRSLTISVPEHVHDRPLTLVGPHNELT